MDQSVLFAVDNDYLHHLGVRESLGDDVIAALQSDLGVTVGETVLPIAHWEHDRTGPLSVALNFAGELVVLVMGTTFTNEAVLLNTLSTLEQWLAPMDMTDLAELSGNEAKFFEGVWELSPRAPLTLASMLRVLLINPTVELDDVTVTQGLPFTRTETLRVEALEAADGTVAIRRTHIRETSLRDPADEPGSSSYEHPVTLQLDTFDEPPAAYTSPDRQSPAHAADDMTIDLAAEEDPEVEAAVEDGATAQDAVDVDGQVDIDLTRDPDRKETSAPPAFGGDWPTIIRGSSYVTAELPLHFDPTGSNVEPISDELFAAGGHLALVVNLDEHDKSPVETASVFRWDASLGQRSLYNLHSFDTAGRRRTLHLFVESATQPNRVLYLGTGGQLAQSDRTDPLAVWLKISPPLDRRRLAFLETGQMPSSNEPDAPPATFSFAANRPTPARGADPAPAYGTGQGEGPASNWVPNV